jgi:PTS system ascorbate-specific IIB component
MPGITQYPHERENDMRIATLCGMGFGTSMLLKLTVDDIVKAEGLKGIEVVPWDLGSFKGQQADIVMGPIDMERHLKDYPAKIVLIKNLVDKTEIKNKVLSAIHEVMDKQGGDQHK